LLAAEVLAALPASVAAAPWRATARAMFWWRRLDADGREAARAVLPAELGSRLRVTAAAGALVSYSDTPVGPYHEVIGLIVARSGARTMVHVPFIAVDSLPSIVGGRANWALPKTLAEFTGEPDASAPVTASTTGWRIQAAARPIGPRLPFASPALASVVQVGPDGDLWRSFSTAHGRCRLARIDAHVEGASFGGWFPSGSCSGATASFTGNFRPARRG
jgi:hypothetical protein